VVDEKEEDEGVVLVFDTDGAVHTNKESDLILLSLPIHPL
jgi:hypothetical protein